MATMYQGQRRSFSFLCVMLFAVALVMGERSAHAQFNSSVEGTVKDTSGAVIPGATVTLRDTRTGIEQQSMTKDQGYFNFASMPPSTYVVTVSRDGFKTTSSAPFVLEPMRVQTIPMALAVGVSTET